MREKKFADNFLYEEKFGFKERNSNFLFYLIITCLLILFTIWRVCWIDKHEMVQVEGNSMRQTLKSGQWLLLDKGLEAKRGDIIVVDVRGYKEFNYGKNGTTHLIKRLIAVEGDKVRCQNGKLEIYNAETGFQWQEVDESGYAYYEKLSKCSFGEYEVKVGEIFFLGDNRNNSVDSRYGITHGSHLTNRLYKAKDIFGIVPQWSIDNQEILEKIFFRSFK